MGISYYMCIKYICMYSIILISRLNCNSFGCLLNSQIQIFTEKLFSCDKVHSWNNTFCDEFYNFSPVLL